MPRLAPAAPTLRPYQRDAVAAVIARRKAGVRRQVVCLPTGSGKTVIFAHLARIAKRPVLVLAHRSELIEQARDKLGRALGDPDLVGIEQADRSAPAHCKVVVCSLRSLHEERLARVVAARDFGLVVYDECHHAVADDNQRVLRTLGALDPAWAGTLLGFTATPVRADGLGLDAVFEEIVYRRSLREMIADGFLVGVRGYRIATAADLTELRRGQRDFVAEELAEAVDIEERNALVARSIQELARDRRTLVFCVTVAHAYRLAEALRAVGVPTGVVHGEQSREDRAEVLRLFRAGALSAVTNVAVLTEGFDDPEVSCVAMARPTRSPGLYAQCVGRGMRPFPGKSDCLILDFVDVSSVPLETLPSLFGLPRQLDFQGRSADEAARIYADALRDAPGLELDPETITLGEIQRRAAAFDPLTLKLDPEVAAISGFAWSSLGSKGVALHVQRRPGWVVEYLVLARGRRRGDRYHVLVDGRKQAHFSRLEDAVEAVDFEVERLGRSAVAGALPAAAWRREPVPARLAQRLPRPVRDHGEAVALACFVAHGPRARS
ncbi:MAG: DEAD/DEAH box helicase [Planctomycetes bacterium]|nr:DEAD/DEAH box helicase [Planctomycetota bacterium]